MNYPTPGKARSKKRLALLAMAEVAAHYGFHEMASSLGGLASFTIPFVLMFACRVALNWGESHVCPVGGEPPNHPNGEKYAQELMDAAAAAQKAVKQGYDLSTEDAEDAVAEAVAELWRRRDETATETLPPY